MEATPTGAVQRHFIAKAIYRLPVVM